MNCSFVYHIRSCMCLFRSFILATKACGYQILAVLVEQVKCGQIGTRRYLDQFGETISNLSLWKRSEESEVEEGVGRGMI